MIRLIPILILSALLAGCASREPVYNPPQVEWHWKPSVKPPALPTPVRFEADSLIGPPRPLTLSWSHTNLVEVDGFYLYLKTNLAQSWIDKVNLGKITNYLIDANQKEFYYTVTAWNASGESDLPKGNQ